MTPNSRIVLKEYGGQRCDVIVGCRQDGTRYLTFKVSPGYGPPRLDYEDVVELLKMMEATP